MIPSNVPLNGRLSFVSSAATNQIRQFSRRRIAYPYYAVQGMGKTHPKDHKTSLRFQMQKFLGKKNYKGEYVNNKYFAPAKDHQPKYITPDQEKGVPLIDYKTGKPIDNKGNPVEISQRRDADRALRPFPNNRFCQTNLNLSNELKEEIYQKIVVKNIPVQEVAVSLGIKIPRLEAVVKLREIEKKWESSGKITSELNKMSKTMYEMFPLFEPPKDSENLSEIPVPVKTLQTRFVTIAETEPFGPVDAAKVFGLEPAAETLDRLATTGDHSHTSQKDVKSKERDVFVAKSSNKERFVFKFTKARVGEVGFRYGTTLRDNKKDRKFTFDNSGKMVNALPTSG